jgi:type I restriction enzyme, R subunit
MNEAETRAEHIDPALKEAGWGVVEGSKILREYPIAPGRIEGHGRCGKPLTADYVLVRRSCTRPSLANSIRLHSPITVMITLRWRGLVSHSR